MNAPFKINRVTSNPNFEKINEIFDFFEIAETRQDKWFEFTSRLLDDLTEDKSIRAVQFHGGKKVLVMMNHKESNFEHIKKAVEKSLDAEFLSYAQILSDNIEKYKLIQLFFNGLFRSEHPLLRYNNLGGHLYCFHSNWIKHNSSNRIWKIPTLDIKVTRDLNLTLDVCTFSDLKYLLKKAKEKGKDAQSKILNKPRYVLINNNTMRRKIDGEDLQEFVIGSASNKKTNIKFIDLFPAEKFGESKMGMLDTIVKRFNRDYADYIDLSFTSIDGNDYQSYDFDKKTKKENSEAIKAALNKQPIKIIDEIRNDTSAQQCEIIQKAINDTYQLKASIGKRPDENALNISLIHEPDYYELNNLSDPHNKIYEGYSIQHITAENGLENLDDSLSNIMQNALIKKDIINKQITLFDWTKLNQNETISFAIAEKDSKIKDLFHYYYMDVKPDGSFAISELTNTMFSSSEYQTCMEIFQPKGKNNTTVNGFIRDNLGNINVILDTDMITLPDSEKITEAIQAGETNIKRASTFEAFYSGLMNIKMFNIDEKTYFCVGRKDKNPLLSIPRAVNIREIRPYQEAPIFFEKLLSLMSVEFVRNKQLTVLPFPFKYLREWLEMNRCKA